LRGFEARREQPGFPAVTIRDLSRATLRHQPDRIIVGEVRAGSLRLLLDDAAEGMDAFLAKRPAVWQGR